jgi:hypothetical protein
MAARQNKKRTDLVIVIWYGIHVVLMMRDELGSSLIMTSDDAAARRWRRNVRTRTPCAVVSVQCQWLSVSVSECGDVREGFASAWLLR